MIYSSDDPRAIYAMERQRTGNYGNDIEILELECPVCGSRNANTLYYSNHYNEYVGCDMCIEKVDDDERYFR